MKGFSWIKYCRSYVGQILSVFAKSSCPKKTSSMDKSFSFLLIRNEVDKKSQPIIWKGNKLWLLTACLYCSSGRTWSVHFAAACNRRVKQPYYITWKSIKAIGLSEITTVREYSLLGRFHRPSFISLNRLAVFTPETDYPSKTSYPLDNSRQTDDTS